MNIKYKGTPSSLRKTHRGLILSEIHRNPEVSRSELARTFGLSDMAATRIVRELISADIIEEFPIDSLLDEKKLSVGRPKIGLKINENGLYSAGVTLSSYYSEVSISNAKGDIIARKKIDNIQFHDIKATALLFANTLKHLIHQSNVEINRMVGVGVALSASTEPSKGLILGSEYFDWKQDNGIFHDIIASTLGIPVEVENISNAVAIAEMRFGKAIGISNFVLAHIATLAGACIVSNGYITRGNNNLTGKIGHLHHSNTNLTCLCGQNDCLNLSATGFALLNQFKLLRSSQFNSNKIEYYASSLLDIIDNDSNNSQLCNIGSNLALTLDIIFKILNPEVIILSGYIGSQKAYIKGAISQFESLSPSNRYLKNRIIQGKISPVEAAPLLALHTYCYSEKLDFDRFNNLNHGHLQHEDTKRKYFN